MNQNELSFSNLTYLEAIYRLYRYNRSVHPVDMANDLQVSKPSVTRAIRLLTDQELIQKGACGEIIMTKQGISIAEALCERCKALKAFLEQTIGFTSQPPYKELVRLSYSMNEETVHAIQSYLKKTNTDSSAPVVSCS